MTSGWERGCWGCCTMRQQGTCRPAGCHGKEVLPCSACMRRLKASLCVHMRRQLMTGASGWSCAQESRADASFAVRAAASVHTATARHGSSQGVLRLCAQMRVLQPELPPMPPGGSADPESAAPEPADAGCHVSSAAPARAAAEEAPERPAAAARAAAGALQDARSGVLTRRSAAVVVGMPLLQPCASRCATCRLCPGLTFLLPAHSLH